jgi:hypothetical protein
VRLPVRCLALSAAVPDLQALRTLPQIGARPVRSATLINATSLARHSRQFDRTFRLLPAKAFVLDGLFRAVGLEELLVRLGIELCILKVCSRLIGERSFDSGQTILEEQLHRLDDALRDGEGGLLVATPEYDLTSRGVAWDAECGRCRVVIGGEDLESDVSGVDDVWQAVFVFRVRPGVLGLVDAEFCEQVVGLARRAWG